MNSLNHEEEVLLRADEDDIELLLLLQQPPSASTASGSPKIGRYLSHELAIQLEAMNDFLQPYEALWRTAAHYKKSADFWHNEALVLLDINSIEDEVGQSRLGSHVVQPRA
ncbi:unnamed protein product [Protopolystoma xenopodis]|uniref:Uncharacterized protein n=1 Tax=Protopolystoma xenopodis TaxID=117903 RepID=A0A3S5AMS8_9PLAT|nr:unnamed protein product [Protopolystoma xenopodis]